MDGSEIFDEVLDTARTTPDFVQLFWSVKAEVLMREDHRVRRIRLGIGAPHKGVRVHLLHERAELVVLEVARQQVSGKARRVDDAEGGAAFDPMHELVRLGVRHECIEFRQERRQPCRADCVQLFWSVKAEVLMREDHRVRRIRLGIGAPHKGVRVHLLHERAELVVLEVARQQVSGKARRVDDAEGGAAFDPMHELVRLGVRHECI